MASSSTSGYYCDLLRDMLLQKAKSVKKKKKNKKKPKKRKWGKITTKRTAEGGEGTGKINRDTSNHVPHLAWRRCFALLSNLLVVSRSISRRRLLERCARSVCLIEDDCFFGVRFSGRLAKISGLPCCIHVNNELRIRVRSFVRSYRCVTFASYYNVNREDGHGGYCAKGMAEGKQRFAPCR